MSGNELSVGAFWHVFARLRHRIESVEIGRVYIRLWHIRESVEFEDFYLIAIETVAGWC